MSLLKLDNPSTMAVMPCSVASPPSTKQLDKANFSHLRTRVFHEEVENRQVLQRASQHIVIERLVRYSFQLPLVSPGVLGFPAFPAAKGQATAVVRLWNYIPPRWWRGFSSLFASEPLSDSKYICHLQSVKSHAIRRINYTINGSTTALRRKWVSKFERQNVIRTTQSL